MVFWKRELRELEASGHRFEDIFRIFSTEFTDTPFSLQFTAGQTQRMSYAELTALTNRLARVLHAHFAGQEGAFLAIRMENSPLWVAAFFGTLMAGFRPLLLNLRLDDATLAPVEQLAAGVLTDRPRAGCIDLSAAGDAAGFTPVWADEIALMTSGTTGTPKLVLYDGAAITAQLLQSESIVRKCPEVKHDRLARELRMLAFLPFYHIFGLMASLLWFIFFGVTFVFLERYDSRSIQYACKVGRVTHFFAVPPCGSRRPASSCARQSGRGRRKSSCAPCASPTGCSPSSRGSAQGWRGACCSAVCGNRRSARSQCSASAAEASCSRRRPS